MFFAPDTEDMLEFIVALVNTDPAGSRSGTEELADVADLAAMLVEYRYTGRVDGDRRELEQVLRARDELRRLWSLGRDDMVHAINELMEHSQILPKLLRHDGLDWHLHTTSPDAPLAERLRIEAAFALVDVIRADAGGRLRVCEAPDCDGLLVDLSRNGSKRFCSVRCSNRVNMIAYRRRQAEDGES